MIKKLTESYRAFVAWLRHVASIVENEAGHVRAIAELKADALRRTAVWDTKTRRSLRPRSGACTGVHWGKRPQMPGPGPDPHPRSNRRWNRKSLSYSLRERKLGQVKSKYSGGSSARVTQMQGIAIQRGKLPHLGASPKNPSCVI